MAGPCGKEGEEAAVRTDIVEKFGEMRLLWERMKR